MLRFRQFIVEYLTDEQREKFSKHKMTAKARSSTDHFFGKDNDIVHGELDHEHQHDKSEVHKAVEHHLGKELSHDEYRSGITKDKYGRDVKLGKSIKDEKLRNDFASDTARDGAKKKIENFSTSTVRGTEVAGQTNPEPNKEHPNGHSWKDLSCKNIHDGDNKHYLPHEIKNGTVVHRVHDHNGQEIYRAALQPLHHDEGHVMYHVDSEYGIKHPSFTKSAEDTAKKLSGKHTDGVFHPKVKVYRQISGSRLHPDASQESLHKTFSDHDPTIRKLVAKHQNANAEHLHKALNDENEEVRKAAAENTKAGAEHLHKALKDSKYYVRIAAAKNKNANAEHIHKALEDKDYYVRTAAARNENANSEHLHRALGDENGTVRVSAAEHPNANAEHLHKALDKEQSSFVRMAAARNKNANSEHLHRALDDPNEDVRKTAVENKNAKTEHFEKALKDDAMAVRIAAKRRIAAKK